MFLADIMLLSNKVHLWALVEKQTMLFLAFQGWRMNTGHPCPLSISASWQYTEVRAIYNL